MVLETNETVKMYTGLYSKEVVLKLYNIIRKKVKKNQVLERSTSY